MRAQAYPVTDLTGGLDVTVDAQLLTDSKSPNLRLVRFEGGKLVKEKGLSIYGSVTAATVMLLYQYKQFDGDTYEICVTTTSFYVMAAGTYTVNSGVTFTGDEDNAFSATTFNNKMYLTNAKDDIAEFDGTTLKDHAATKSAGYLCHYLLSFHNCLFLLRTIEAGIICPYRVRWSKIGDADDYTDSTSGAFDLLDTPGRIIGATILGDRMYVFKEDSIWEIYYVGTDDVTFDARMIVASIGTRASQTIQAIKDKVYLFGTDNVYTFNGSTVEEIGDALHNWLYKADTNIVNESKLNRAPAIYHQAAGDYIIVVPTNTDIPGMLLRFNVKEQTWTRQDIAATVLGLHSATTRTLWSTATGTWNAAAWDTPWRHEALPPGTDTLLIGNTTGTIYEDDRVTKNTTELMVWESKDFIFAPASRICWIKVQAKGDPFSIAYSLDEGLSWSPDEEVTPDTEKFSLEKIPVNETTQKLRVRIRTWNDDFEMEWLEPWYIGRAKSL